MLQCLAYLRELNMASITVRLLCAMAFGGAVGIERGRTRVEWVSAAEGAKFSATMNDFAKTITELGENRKLGDLRCKK